MTILTEVLGLLARGVQGVGLLLIVWFGIQSASAFQQHNGSGIKDGLWGVGAGVMVYLLGELLKSITF